MIKTPFLSKTMYPWIVWVLAASFFYYKYLIQVSPGVMSAQLMSTYSLTGAGLGNLAACFFYGYLLMQIPVGILLDKYSPGKVTAIAAFICAIGVFLFAQTYSPITAGFCRFLTGLSASFAAVACFKLASIWFSPKRFALVAGLSMTAAMLGAVGGQGPLSLLITKFGWRYTLELVGILGVILSFLIWIIIRDKESEQTSLAMNEDIHLLTKLIVLLKDKQTWVLCLYSGLAFAPLSVFGGLWGVSFLRKAYMFDVSQSANYISLIFIGFAIGSPLNGWLSDHMGKRKPIMVLGTLFAFISMFVIVYLPLSHVFLSFFLFLFGLSASGFFLCFSMIRELYPLAFTGTVLGFMNTFDSIWEALTEPFIGKLLDLTWLGTYENGARSFSLDNYHHSLMALLIYLGLALFLLFFIEETYCKQKEEEYSGKGVDIKKGLTVES